MITREDLGAFHQALIAAAIPVDGVIFNGGVVTIQYSPSATAQQRTTGDALINTFDPVADALAKRRAATIALLNGGDQMISRAMLLVLLDEINTIRGLLVPSQTARTLAQMKTAITNKINSGVAD